MNITQEMIESVQRDIITLTGELDQSALPVRYQIRDHISSLNKLVFAYKRILELEIEIEELHSK